MMRIYNFIKVAGCSVIVVNSFGGCGNGGGGGKREGAHLENDQEYKPIVHGHKKSALLHDEPKSVFAKLSLEAGFPTIRNIAEYYSPLNFKDVALIRRFVKEGDILYDLKSVVDAPIKIFHSQKITTFRADLSVPRIKFAIWNNGQCGVVFGVFRLPPPKGSRFNNFYVSIDVLLSRRDTETLECHWGNTTSTDNSSSASHEFPAMSSAIAKDVGSSSQLSPSDSIRALTFALYNLANLWTNKKFSSGFEAAFPQESNIEWGSIWRLPHGNLTPLLVLVTKHEKIT